MYIAMNRFKIVLGKEKEFELYGKIETLILKVLKWFFSE